MKIIGIVIVFLLLITSADSIAKDYWSKEKDVYIVRGDKKLIGAKVEVFTEEGVLVTAQTLQTKKIIIDFGNSETGIYIIKLTKGDRVEKYQFRKEN